jgi:outer membrane protein insertion porin family
LNYDPTKGWFLNERVTWYGLIPNLEKEFFMRSDTKLEGYLKLIDLPVTENWSFKLVLAGYTGLSTIIPVQNGINTKNARYIDGLINGRGWSES